MKVTDAEILQAIWRAQVKKTARGVIDNYIGGTNGLKRDSEQDRHYAQYQHMIGRGNLGIALGKGQLARRLKALIGGENLQWQGSPGHVYEFRTEAAMDVFRFARIWWAGHGVPSGWDADNQCMRTMRLDNYDTLAAQLEQELLERYGNLTVTP